MQQEIIGKIGTYRWVLAVEIADPNNPEDCYGGCL